ncbi:MAG: tRNA (N(6)-L-threonylcarbamoyladenosine(37)-C(2))-methylthiotransferase [Candidatus Methanomethylophilus sp.]|nr:tRNA (N(6)-L-threonylcarbamoyladenosine(37)-C(2))-methylthiotransferase [Methanomethylophilus sp.]MDD4668594.1 tRNA (N(6)-L-threonylcarbamoyladenosine(37)-C(2))-methylthiotransferase [Methanomethylophilus sp.]
MIRYFVESYGCTMNYGEGAELAEQLDRLGYIRAVDADTADLVVLNTCTVVDTTEKRMIRRMNELRAAGKQVVVTGCMAKVQAGRIRIRLPGALIVPPENYDTFSAQVRESYGCGTPVLSAPTPVTAIIPIAQGCRGNCTYCITRFARGPLQSYDPAAIKERFDRLIDGGAREVLITAQDTGCYGLDLSTDLGELLRLLLKKKGDYRIRIGMMNPNSLRPVLDSVLDAMKDRRVYRFLHLPVQSGSNPVLKAMSRRYTAEEFFALIADIRTHYPEMSIATDLIAAFPGETDTDQAASVALIRRLRADTVNITRFSARPGTVAFSMPQLNGRIAKDRSTELTAVKTETEADVNRALIGRRFPVLVTEHGVAGSVIARTDNYRPIALREELPLGTFTTAEVTGTEATYLTGRTC